MTQSDMPPVDALAGIAELALPDELWLPIVNFECLYASSDFGRIGSCERRVRTANGTRRVRARILKPGVDNVGGYHRVGLCVDGKQIGRTVHSLVAETFHGPCPPGMEVRHLDGDPGNNRASNLVWGTRVENMADVIRHGRNREMNKTHCKYGHLLAPPNLVPSQVRHGRRVCLACSRGHGNVLDYARRGVVLDHQTESDRHYARIMAA